MPTDPSSFIYVWGPAGVLLLALVVVARWLMSENQSGREDYKDLVASHQTFMQEHLADHTESMNQNTASTNEMSRSVNELGRIIAQCNIIGSQTRRVP